MKKEFINNNNKEDKKAALEAILFIATDSIQSSKLVDTLEISTIELDELILELQQELSANSRGLALIKVAGGYRLCTKNKVSHYINKFTKIQDKKLSQPLLETLAIIAFKQPVTKQEIEEIRGVNSDKMIRRLLERELIHEVGRKKIIGRPILYGTTATFLQCFGLGDLQDLPDLPDLSYEQKKAIFQESSLFDDMDIQTVLQDNTNNINIENELTVVNETEDLIDPIDVALRNEYNDE